MKICNRCSLSKDDLDFYGGRNVCKRCISIQKKEYGIKNADKIRQYRHTNSSRIKKYSKSYYEKNRETVLLFMKDRYSKNTEEVLAQNKISYKKNERKHLSRKLLRNKLRYKNEPAFRLRSLVSGSIRCSLHKSTSSKNKSSILQYLPYSFDALKAHIERRFEPWMNWDNQGKYNPETWDDNNLSTWTWQLDHIIPQSKLLYVSMEDDNFQKCWSLKNLRPLSAKQNISDGAR